jgi:molybdate transport system substrate-binding protein
MQNMHDLMRGLICRLVGCLVPLLALAGWPGQPAQAQTLKVAAASNLKFALADLETQYRQQTARKTEFIFGASVQLARQIQQGLPVQLFISADEEQVAWLAQAGLTRDGGQRYALGRLALISPKASGIAVTLGLEAAVKALKPNDKVAIANPLMAPYGRAAQETLQRAGAWPRVHKQLVLGDHIGQATQFVLSGAAPLGITAYSLTLVPEAADRLQVWPVPAELHAPLPQRLVLLKNAGPQAEAFRDYLLSSAARPIWLRHGYALPQ